MAAILVLGQGVYFLWRETAARRAPSPEAAAHARPMMYLALSYDHRLVDGKEAVTFLVRVKEALEDPERLLLDL
jgi:pyruvate/2-oxoglutarate dehydrogenase complex dihydrolipoamide acyltransferase (E2) component